ncbi:MAG: glycosyltransferase family 4 protein [Gomphosphaeria aponina SAG 52.96 = DSM 107014]|uniref:Glycosyltransferase family 4 protein n=1 Tax=Gomphosphaeria aponina SAG 52.96 = DSM 107014 TaxID=1521640 RepID=A0A941GTD9_9CHRO|nr:glycosyltransferase family 4 protein [Gomphosphaeria aponina SAG 52.96 = DSM 107014]
MRILYDHQMFAIQKFGGITRIFIELMRELSANSECKIDWYRGWHQDGYNIQDYRNQLGRYWAFSRDLLKLPNYDRLNQLTFKAFILTGGKQADIYHPTYYDASLLSLVKPKKLVTTVHDMILEKFLGNIERFQSVRAGKQQLIEKSDLLFVASENTKKDLIEILQVEPAKIKITYWGTRIKDIIPSQLPKICQEKPYFLYVGTRSKYKEFDKVIAAFAQDKWLQANFNVVCFGGTSDFTQPELASMEKAKVRDKFIYLSGDDSLLKALYQNAQALVYTSRYEGFGLPTLEAMVCQCPVICCPTSSLPEVVGQAAAFFNPDSIEELITQMQMVVEDREKRASMLAKGQERAKLFSWEKTARLTLAGYQQIV